MKSRKLIALLIVLVLILTGITGCGKKETAVSKDGKTRSIRTADNNSEVLPAPAEGKEEAGDKERFDTYVYTVDKLKQNYDSVIVLDARSQEEYDKGHLPNAVRATWQEWSNVSVDQASGEWAHIQSYDELSKLFGNLGIDGTKPVVIYTDTQAGWGEEGRQLWTFRVFGLTDTYILNGGIKAWKDAGGEISTEATTITPVTGPTPSPNEALIAETDYLAKNLDTLKLLDTREDAEYAGTKNYGQKTNGRIPGSKHIWFKDFYNADGTLLTPAQIRARVEALGYTTDDEIVLYCTGGIRSGFTTIVLQAAGFTKARNYNLSFSAWAGTDQKIDKEVLKELEVY
jgi:thiosulfate/3-mercaptopyruvate sulfurtransferase